MTKRALLDTNIIIHREANKVTSQDIGILYRYLDKSGYVKCVHSITIDEIKKNPNKITVNNFLVKLDSYQQIQIPSPIHDEIKLKTETIDVSENDINDTLLLNEVFIGRVDIFVTEDKSIHKKAELLNISNKVFTIDSFLEDVFAKNPKLINYKVLNVRKMKFGDIPLTDKFFDSLKEDYSGFEKWFIRKYDEEAYVTINTNNNLLLSFLYLKVESENENYTNISPIFTPKKRLKIGTFKVVSNGFRLGERFLKIIFDNALRNRVEEIYVTIYDKKEEQKRLIALLETWGFKKYGVKDNSELVFVRDFSPKFDILSISSTYPYISKNTNIYITSIYPKYHTELLPDSILNTESPSDFIEDLPHRNGINKIYISRAFENIPKKGDIIIFYRTGGLHKGVITTIGIVQDIRFNFQNEEDFIAYCRKISVFPEPELRNMWKYKTKKPFAIRFLYVYSFPKRINMKKLIELNILQSIEDAPRGFRPISKEDFTKIIKETNSDESFIIN